MAGALLGVTLLGSVLVACGDDDGGAADTTAAATTTVAPTTAEETTTTVGLRTLAEIVGADSNLSILLGYAVTAGLNGALTGGEEYTLFAPTNDAFEAAQAEVPDLAAITSDTELLTQILTYHVVRGALDPLPTEEVDSVEGSPLALDGSVTPRTVNDVPILEEVRASNGVLYVIDELLIPPTFVAPTTAAPTTQATTTTTVALQTIPATLVTLGQYSTLTSLLAATGLEPVLSAAGPFTLWAPTDAAFSALPPATLSGLAADPNLLRQVLLYHVLQGAAAGADLTSRAYRTAQGQDIQVQVGDPIVVNGTAKVVQPNVLASNGVIYGIDQVLVPPGVTLPS